MSSPAGAIVVGYDGSPGSRAALDWATAEAARQHAALRILEVFELVVWSRSSPGTVVPLEVLVESRRRGLEAAADGSAPRTPGLAVRSSWPTTRWRPH